MGELKPLGSEKLQGNEKLKRILELTYYDQNKKNKSSINESVQLVKETNSGVFGIVKEKDGYYVKRGLTENKLDYIGGLFMKNKNKFSSYAEALKRMELLVGQENLQEATKYVLKTKNPQQGSPAPEAPMDTPPPSPEGEAPAPELPSPEGEAPTPELPSPEGEVPAPDMEGGEPELPETGGDSSKPSDYMSEVQKFAGKLGQELRDQKAKMESDDIKYVLNMIISAVDLNKLELEDLEEIGKKFDREEEPETEEPEPTEEPETEEPETEEPTGDEELGETMSKLDKFIKSPILKQEDEIDLSKYSDLGKGDTNEEVKELDLDEIKDEINARIGETLSKYFK
jgi:hypothetical protein